MAPPPLPNLKSINMPVKTIMKRYQSSVKQDHERNRDVVNKGCHFFGCFFFFSNVLTTQSKNGIDLTPHLQPLWMCSLSYNLSLPLVVSLQIYQRLTKHMFGMGKRAFSRKIGGTAVLTEWEGVPGHSSL